MITVLTELAYKHTFFTGAATNLLLKMLSKYPGSDELISQQVQSLFDLIMKQDDFKVSMYVYINRFLDQYQ